MTEITENLPWAKSWIHPMLEKVGEIPVNDSAHDSSHGARVLKNALMISEYEGGDKEVLTAASFLHDVGAKAKDDPNRHLSSEVSSRFAEKFLRTIEFPMDKIQLVKECIECHSYSAGKTPSSIEAKVFQDADRLDAIGAVGLARVFTVGGSLKRKLYNEKDPFCESGRNPDDSENCLDHFFLKLLKIPEKMQTRTGKLHAENRKQQLKWFMENLKEEITWRE